LLLPVLEVAAVPLDVVDDASGLSVTALKLACISLYGQHRVHRSEVGLFLVSICELPVRLQVTQDFLLGSHHDVEGVLEATRGGREEIWSLVAGRVRV
jgi:hypothetical protein